MLNVQGGVSFSKLDSRIGSAHTTFLDQTRTDASFFAGLEYLEKKHWSISSNVGFLRKGGKEPWWVYDFNGNLISTTTAFARFDYLSVNTTFNFKYPIKERWIPFLSIGPRVDFLLDHDHFFPYFETPGVVRKQSYGLVAAAGIRYQFPRFQVGLKGDHLFSFNKLAAIGQETNQVNVSMVSLTFGVRFK
jgi:hypothetical protein